MSTLGAGVTSSAKPIHVVVEAGDQRMCGSVAPTDESGDAKSGETIWRNPRFTGACN